MNKQALTTLVLMAFIAGHWYIANAFTGFVDPWNVNYELYHGEQ